MATAINSTSLEKTDNKIILGQGGYGIVYEDIWNGSKVAVKRIQLFETTSKREEEALKKLDHPNVVKLFHVDKDKDFNYYVLEFCETSLEKLFLKEEDPHKYRGPMPSENQVFLQLAKGLEHIHEMKLIHRDIKPHNVLIYVQSNRKDVTMKWADFGLSKPVNERGTYSMSGIRGTLNWYAAEILDIMEEDIDNSTPSQRGTVKSDVFAEGLVFGYYLLGGKHPYGTQHQIPHNILENKPVNLNGITKRQPIHDIITEMLKTNPHERISSSDVVIKITSIEGEGKSIANLLKQLDHEDPLLSIWDDYLTPASMGIFIMSQLLICSTRVTDFNINSEIDKNKINLVIHPESFRKTLVQISNESYEAFMLAHTNMEIIQLQMAQVPDNVKNSINIIESNDKNAIEKLLPRHLKRIEETAADGLKYTRQIRDSFFRLGQLIRQVILAVQASRGARTEEIEELTRYEIEERKKRQEESKQREQDLLQKEMEGAQEAVQRTQKNVEEACKLQTKDLLTYGTSFIVRGATSYLNKTQAKNWLQQIKQEAKQVEKEKGKIWDDYTKSLKNLQINVGKDVSASEIIKLLEKGTKQLGEMHEKWAGMTIILTINLESINNCIGKVNKFLVDFVGDANDAQHDTSLLEFMTDSIEKSLTSSIKSHHVGATYVKVSHNYIMTPLKRMHEMLTIEPAKLEETQKNLLELCTKAMQGIQDLGNEDRNQTIREIENQLQNIQN